MNLSIITLTTDFGTKDWFVGTMKGVALGINPAARLVDLTHEIAQGDIRAGAFTVAVSYRYFPKGTVHLVVVDPGVGSARKAIAAKTANYHFVGPDNGVLSWALAREKVLAIHELRNKAFFLGPLSRTFHGRDLFAPVAAHLCRGVPIGEFGPAVDDFIRIPWPGMKQAGNEIHGEVVYIDRFGNAITNIEAAVVERHCSARVEVLRAGKRICDLGDFYGAVPLGKPVAVIGSSGFLEIAVNGGSAAKALKLELGSGITVCRH